MDIRPNRIKDKLAAGEIATIVGGNHTPRRHRRLRPHRRQPRLRRHLAGRRTRMGRRLRTRKPHSRLRHMGPHIHLPLSTTTTKASSTGPLTAEPQGIVVPHVNNAAEAQNVVDGGKFPPIGKRGSYTSRQGLGRTKLHGSRRRQYPASHPPRRHHRLRKPRRNSRRRPHRCLLRGTGRLRRLHGTQRQHRPPRRRRNHERCLPPHRRLRQDRRRNLRIGQRHTFPRPSASNSYSQIPPNGSTQAPPASWKTSTTARSGHPCACPPLAQCERGASKRSDASGVCRGPGGAHQTITRRVPTPSDIALNPCKRAPNPQRCYSLR